jgi:predicted enzyme related to lactoylglutathione lyase
MEFRMTAPVVHFEIGVRDVAKARGFYGPLLGWEFSPYGEAAMIANLGATAGTPGIGGHINSLGHPPHNYCVVYALVEDLAATIAHAEQLGGKQLVPPTEVPGMGHFAWVSDPEGNTLGLWKPLVK